MCETSVDHVMGQACVAPIHSTWFNAGLLAIGFLVIYLIIASYENNKKGFQKMHFKI